MPSIWPEKAQPEVAVFVDYTNIVRGVEDIYQGRFSPEKIIGQIRSIARNVGFKMHMAIYLETHGYKWHEPMSFMELGLAARAVNAKVIHVPDQNERDNVDAVMIEDMLYLNRHHDRRVPFLLATADSDFIPAIAEIRKQRQVYIGVPTQPRLPGIARVATGWHFIDAMSWRHMALYDALNHHESLDPDYVRSAQVRFHDYASSLNTITEFLRALEPFPTLICIGDVVTLLQQRLHKKLPDLPEQAWWYHTRALEYYRVIERGADEHFRLNFTLHLDHPAFERLDQLKAS